MQPLFSTRWLSATDLWRDPSYLRLWSSMLMSSLGSQITLLAIPLTAAALLHASASQMGWLTFMELLPFMLLSLPCGVWLDRVRKLPVYIAGESMLAVGLLVIPLAWYFDVLTMGLLYGMAFFLGSIHMTVGSAAQIVLTQMVPRERLVEAHAKNALASSGADVVGPGLAGVLIKLVSAPFALILEAILLCLSVLILRGLRLQEATPATAPTPSLQGHSAASDFWRDLREGLRFVIQHRLLVRMAMVMGMWQMLMQSAMVVQILLATRELGLNEREVGLCYISIGIGTICASVWGNRLSRRIGPGPSMVVGLVLNGVGWLQLALAPAGAWGIAAFALMLSCFGAGAVLLGINFLAIRQALTPDALLGRMTSTMRWLILLGAGPGALIGGYLGEHLGLRWATALGGISALLLALWTWGQPQIRGMRVLPVHSH